MKLFRSARLNCSIVLHPSLMLVILFTTFCLLMIGNVLLKNVIHRSNPSLNVSTNPVFDGFNNESGTDHFIVPNIIHLIRFNKTEFTFIDYICIQAAHHNHGPDYFYIHTDIPEGRLKGKYWNLIKKDQNLMSRIRILPLEAPTEIFGQQINPKWRFFHGGDIARIRVLMKYGGIYLDNDVYIIKSLSKYRKFEITLNWDEDQFLASQLIIANKDARFLPLWLDSYREYRPDEWYYNAGERPTTEILVHHPELIHRVKVNFGADTDLSQRLYIYKQFKWWKLEAIHLMINHRIYMDPQYKKTPYFDEIIVKNYPFPIGALVREMVKASGMMNLLK